MRWRRAAPPRRAVIADRANNLALGLLLSVEPSDRALAGWAIEPEQVNAVRLLAQRPLNARLEIPGERPL